MDNKSLKEEFKKKYISDVRCVSQIFDEVADWWLTKMDLQRKELVEAIIGDVAKEIKDNTDLTWEEVQNLIMWQIKSKYLK